MQKLKHFFLFFFAIASFKYSVSQTIYNNTTTTVVLSGSSNSTVDIIIQRGAIVRLTGTLTMSPGKKITVEKGAYLDVDGGTITGAGSSKTQRWGGIIVEGTYNARHLQPIQ